MLILMANDTGMEEILRHRKCNLLRSRIGLNQIGNLGLIFKRFFKEI
jgi:hypothetical protein